jgi:hypothetical protein
MPAMTDKLTDLERDLLEALDWALAEVQGRTKYQKPGQFDKCYIKALAARDKAEAKANG